jgi:hypothetical protein
MFILFLINIFIYLFVLMNFFSSFCFDDVGSSPTKKDLIFYFSIGITFFGVRHIIWYPDA